ncbi:hypothetical protein CFC21_071437 [Triticum aestivum]|uniref:Uncharacterized protein n=3 Tax=Triticum TaxID=4564 RepID=A0A9R0X8L0_TRITD|nr:uncharacterized protein LOC123111805 [Triticum aestivum]KAF7065320.1 hypothetical protein CFC21_071437 [Triticum aestivum]VAI31961.1 unnamed protein product [Triticum turgidum subsp. durum]
MDRKFLNMVLHEYGSRMYSLCRIKLSTHLFYPTAKDATTAHEDANARKKKHGGWPSTISSCKRPPSTLVNFSVPPSTAAASNMRFFSLLPEQGESSVMFTDPSCNSAVYDMDMKSFVLAPSSYFCKPYDSITVSIRNRCSSGNFLDHEDDHGLYVMNSLDDSFEFFSYCKVGLSTYPLLYNKWYWSPLPSPPSRTSPLVAAAVIDNSTICASSKNGTYTFDISREVWSHTGSWVLPFHRAAEYVPELGLWFGLQAPGTWQNRLCAFDLSSSAMAESAPSPLHDWEYLDLLPDELLPVGRALVNLGSGKFCIATHCRKDRSALQEEDELENIRSLGGNGGVQTLLTGVEVVRCADGLQLIHHKSQRYNIENLSIHCVL